MVVAVVGCSAGGLSEGMVFCLFGGRKEAYRTRGWQFSTLSILGLFIPLVFLINTFRGLYNGHIIKRGNFSVPSVQPPADPPALPLMTSPREDILANILQTLSSSTDTSILLWSFSGCVDDYMGCCSSLPPSSSISGENYRCHEGQDGHNATNSSHVDDGGQDAYLNNMVMWLDRILMQNKSITENSTSCSADINHVMDVILDMTMDEDGMDYRDDTIWQAGLTLIRRLFVDTSDDPMNDGISNKLQSLEMISPHVLLRTVLDSYYFNGNDDELGVLHPSGDHSTTQKSCLDLYNLPTSLAMFQVRTLLASHAIQDAVRHTQQSLKTASTIRWRRLKSMVDDTVFLFQKMLLELIGKTFGTEVDSRTQVQPTHIVSIATSNYVRHIFPSCKELLLLVLKASSTDSTISTSFETRVLETCYNCLGMFTSLLALEFVFGDTKEDTTSSSSTDLILTYLDRPSSSSFYDVVLSSGRNTASKNDRGVTYCLLTNATILFGERGPDLVEDLLMYPTFFSITTNEHKYDDSEDETNQQLYDSLGIALIAYHKLHSQTHSRKDSLPFPFSGEYLWTLVFPHIRILLEGLNSSSTLKRLEAMELVSEDDLNGVKPIELGLDMLQVLLSQATNVRPMSSYQINECQSDVFKLSHTAKGTEPTVESLLSLAVKISMLEATSRGQTIIGSAPQIPIKYTSLQVTRMSEILLKFYNPATQTHIVGMLSRKMKESSHIAVLLPRVLDWLRPIIMSMLGNTQNHDFEGGNNNDAAVVMAIIDIISPFIQDLVCIFDTSSSLIPADVSHFVTITETYSSVVSVVRLVRMLVWRCKPHAQMNTEGKGSMESFRHIVDWTENCIRELEGVDSALSRLIAMWTAMDMSDEAKKYRGLTEERPPEGWQRVFLLHHILQDCFEQPDKSI